MQLFDHNLFALRLAPAGIVSALRETSVVFGMLIAAFILREQVDGRRAGGTAVIAIGGIFIVAAAAFPTI